MVVAFCRATLYLSEAHSLKDKRKLVKSLIDRLRRRYNLSALEVGSRDLWGKAEIGLALVERDRREAAAKLERALRELEATTGLKHIEYEVEYTR